MAIIKVQNNNVMIQAAQRVSPSHVPIGISVIFPYVGEVVAFGSEVKLDIAIGDRVYFDPTNARVVGEFLVVDEYAVDVAIQLNDECEAGCGCGDEDEAELRTIDIYQEIVLERQYQDDLWGTKNDDKNNEEDWVSYITEYASGLSERTKNKGFRERLIKVAALAVAALEAIDRKENAAKE